MPWIDRQGYVRVWHQGRDTREHRVVAEQMLGRPLLSTEHVHHRNGVKSDNRPENLEVKSGRLHLLEHWQEGHYDPRVQSQQVPERPCVECHETARIHGQDRCRRCYMRQAQEEHRQRDPEAVREAQRRYRERNREAIAARKRERRRQGKAG